MIRALTVLASIHRQAAACERTRIAGVEALVGSPRSGEGPAVVYANVCTPLGIEQPGVGRFLSGLARAGYVAVAPELPRVRDGEVTPATVDALVSVSGCVGPRVTLVGASTGAGLAILAAADPHLAERVTAVLAIAPYASLERILRLATTGFYCDRPYPSAPVVSRATLRSLAASAPDDPAVPALIANCDPQRFDRLYAALDPRTRALVDEMSPESRIGRVAAPVELVADPDDAFFPVDEAHALVRAGTDVRLTVTQALEHVQPRFRPGLARLVLALERTLQRAAQGESSPALQPAAAT